MARGLADRDGVTARRIVLLAVLGAGCGGDGGPARDTPADPRPSPFPLDWASLSNPILQEPDRMLKDQCVVFHDGEFFVFPSTRFEEDDPERDTKRCWFYRSRDLRNWDRFDDPDLGCAFGSPDVTRDARNDRWIMTFQYAVDPDDDHARRIAYATSDDLVDWSPPTLILPWEMWPPGERVIDAALALQDDLWVVGFKAMDVFFVSGTTASEPASGWSEPALVFVDGQWDWAENYQFLRIDGRWHMVATARDPDAVEYENPYTDSHEPFLYDMVGTGDDIADWGAWENKRMLSVPRESWNARMHANCGYLADWRAQDGYFYLFYAGSEDGESFSRRGHGKIGVVRSRDLVHWSLPGDTE